VNHTLGLLTANLNKSMTIPAFDLNTDLIPTFNVSDKDLHAMIADESILEKLNLIKYHMPIFPDLSDLSNPLNQGAYQFWAVIFAVIFLVVILVFRKAIYKLLKRCLCKKKKLPEQRFLNIVLTASIPSQATGQDPQIFRPRTYRNIGRLDDVSEQQHDGKLT